MPDLGLGLSYWLPQTVFNLDAIRRGSVETTPSGSHVRRVVDIGVTKTAIADPASRQDLSVDADLLARLSLTVNLDERGLICSVSSVADRDIAPPQAPARRAFTVAATSASQLGDDADRAGASLEELWADSHKSLAWRYQAIEDNAGHLLDRMGDPSASAESIWQSGRALEQVQSQLGLLRRARDEWIAAQGLETRSGDWQLTSADLPRVVEAVLPGTLPRAEISPATRRLAEELGVVLAIADPHRPPADALPTGVENTLTVRRSRPVQVGCYVRTEGHGWLLEPASVQVTDVVDAFSESYQVPLDGTWPRSRTFHLAYHPDMSLKAFGLSTWPEATLTERAVPGPRPRKSTATR